MATSILLALPCLAIFLLILFLIFDFPFSSRHNKNKLLRDWPVLGMYPSLVVNFNNLLGWATLVANQPGFMTFMIKGPWFCKQNLLITVDPANLQYMCSTRFANFPRGPKNSEIYDVFGEGYFNLEGTEWRAHRRIHRSFFGQKQFNEFSSRLVFDKVKDDMTVVLDHLAGSGHLGGRDEGVVDLQDLFSRYTHDLTHRLVLGYDPKCLSLQWAQVPFTNAMKNAMQCVWMRHFLPAPIWKLQRSLGVGHEKLLNKSKKFLNKFVDMIVSSKHDQLNSQCSKGAENNGKYNDMVTAYLMADEHYRSGKGDEALKGSLLSLMLGGKDSTAAALVWLFWNLSQKPDIEAKIRDEIASLLSEKVRGKAHVVTQEQVSKLVYLHAAVCETLRLHPPFPFSTRAPHELDILPSGHIVTPNSTMIIIPLYVMARVEAVWGKDCADFKPERWITEDGGLKHEPSYKFFTFNSGVKICFGRELAITEIKAVVATMLHNYNVNVLDKQNVLPLYSGVLQTKHGLHARISKRFV